MRSLPFFSAVSYFLPDKLQTAGFPNEFDGVLRDDLPMEVSTWQWWGSLSRFVRASSGALGGGCGRGSIRHGEAGQGRAGQGRAGRSRLGTARHGTALARGMLIDGCTTTDDAPHSLQA